MELSNSCTGITAALVCLARKRKWPPPAATALGSSGPAPGSAAPQLSLDHLFTWKLDLCCRDAEANSAEQVPWFMERRVPVWKAKAPDYESNLESPLLGRPGVLLKRNASLVIYDSIKILQISLKATFQDQDLNSVSLSLLKALTISRLYLLKPFLGQQGDWWWLLHKQLIFNVET